jgi:hypothetical protein
MAISFECDYCGEAIYHEHDWLDLSIQDRSSGASAAELNRMGLERVNEKMHFHLFCFNSVVRQVDSHREWAQGQSDSPGGLEWQLVEISHRRPAILEPTYENRILDLCRERGINRDELAEQVGTSRGAVGRWLKSHQNKYGRPVGLTEKWAKRLVIFFDLDSTDDLFKREPGGEAPAEEFDAEAAR